MLEIIKQILILCYDFWEKIFLNKNRTNEVFVTYRP